MHSTTRTFTPRNLIPAQLQHSSYLSRFSNKAGQSVYTLEKHENKKLFQLNVHFARIVIRCYTPVLLIHKLCNSFITLLSLRQCNFILLEGTRLAASCLLDVFPNSAQGSTIQGLVFFLLISYT